MVRCFSIRIYQMERRWIEVDLDTARFEVSSQNGWCFFGFAVIVLVLRVPSLPFSVATFLDVFQLFIAVHIVL